jgi:Mg/Co/Ni transporter MgtE
MQQPTQLQQQRSQMIKKFLPSLVINWFIPLMFYSFISNYVSSDAQALALSACIPALWVIVVMVKQHRVDWIGLVGIIGLGVALAISAISGGGSMPFKLYHPLITGPVGLVFIISGIINKPFLVLVLKAFKVGDAERYTQPGVRKKILRLSSLLGIVLLLDATLHIVLAFTVSTGLFLILSRVITISLVASIFAIRWLLSRANKV